MQETWVRSLGQEDPLEEEMAKHSSILAWQIPWKRNLAGWKPWGCKRVKHDWGAKWQQQQRTLWSQLLIPQKTTKKSVDQEKLSLLDLVQEGRQNLSAVLKIEACKVYHCTGIKWRGTKESLDEGEKGEWKSCLKLNINKTKIMASSPIFSWQIEGENVEAVTDFIFLGSKITANGDCNHEIKRCSLKGKLWQT